MFFSSGPSIKNGKEVIKGLYYFPEVGMLDCNQYIIRERTSDELILFDAGNGITMNGLIKGLDKIGLDYTNITNIFLTHEHVDHVLGLYPLMKLLKDDPPKIHALGETARILQSGDESRIFPGNLGINASMFGIEIIPLKVNELVDGQKIKLSNEYTFRVLYTPGHSLGSACYYEPLKKILIPGDLVFIGGSFGRYDFPGGSLPVLIESIKKVNDLDVKYLLPGHMGISTNGNREIQHSYAVIQSLRSYFF